MKVERKMKTSNNKEIIRDLVKQLNSEEWLIRFNAAKILGNIDAEEAIQELLDKLKRENNRDVRRGIVEALKEIDLEVAIPVLIDTMNDDSSMIVRYTAARALGRMGAKEALPAIKNRVLKETNSESIFWFYIAIARLEEDEKGEGCEKIRNLKKKNMLTEKQEVIFSNLVEIIKQKKKK